MMMIPEWLNKYPIFCNHKDKQPYAHTDDINTFKPLDVCLDNMKKDKSLGLGIGLFGNLCAIDIDHCVDEAGVVSDTANKILEMFDGCYAEISYSGTGVHLLFFLKEQHKYQKYYTKMNAEHCKNAGFSDIGGLEFYQGSIDNRYFTLTGNIIPAVHNHGYTVSESKIKTFLDTYMKKPTVTSAPAVSFTSSDEEDIAYFNWARKNSPTLKELASRIPAGSNSTESEDDLEFMKSLAFWCNKNKVLMRKAFESSSYYKNKDDKHKKKWARADYSNNTIEQAISQTTDVVKTYYKDLHYDEVSKTIIEEKGGDIMMAPKISTRTSQNNNEVVTIDTKTFKFEAAMPEVKKNTTCGERTVKWVSVYKKGSNEPSKFLDRQDPAFELAASIVLEKF